MSYRSTLVVYLNYRSATEKAHIDVNKYDRITIKPTNEGCDVVYQYEYDVKNGAPKSKSFMEMSRDKLRKYLESILNMVRKDLHPFHSVDIQLPCFPSVSYNIDALNGSALDYIMDGIDIVADAEF
jgi:hypothetical protein